MGTGGDDSGSGGLDGGGAFGKKGFDAGDLAAQEVQAGRVFQLADLLLHAQVEHFLAQFTAACAQFLDGKLTEFLGLHNGFGSVGLNGGSAGDEAGAQAKLVGGQAAGLLGGRLVDAGDFK
jgi:hypothetical protein